MEKVVTHWKGLPREWRVSREGLDVALGTRGGFGLYLGGLCQPW